MPVLCFGPVCVPLNLLLPFLLGVLHHYGYLKWMKQEWVTFRYWHARYKGWRSRDSTATAPAATAPAAATSALHQQGKQTEEQEQQQQKQHVGRASGDSDDDDTRDTDDLEYEIVCSGDFCSLRPTLRKSISMPADSEARKAAMLRRRTLL